MKKVLKGKVYCTETAKEVARIELKSYSQKKQGNISFMKRTS